MMTAMCVANLWLDYINLRSKYQNENAPQDSWQLFKMIAAAYPASFAIAIFSIVFSIFVFALCGFHSFLVGVN